MANKKIEINNFANSIYEALTEYNNDIDDLVKSETDKLAKEAKKTVKDHSNVSTGQYKSGWAIKTIKGTHSYHKKIYNKKAPSLVHLLEFGHNVVRSGQIVGRTKAYPNVTKYELEYMEKLREAIVKGAKRQ